MTAVRRRRGRRDRIDRDLARYVRRDVYAYSAYYRARLEQSGLGRAGLKTRADLARLPPTELALVDEPGALVLRPDFGSIWRYGSRLLTARALVARGLGTVRRFNRMVIEPRFKPIHWLLSAGVPVGLTVSDLRRLGGVGARWLEVAGVGTNDVIVNLLPAGQLVAYWALVQGARQTRVPCMQAGADADPSDLARVVPSVLAGSADDLRIVLQAGVVSVRTLLVVGEPLPPSPGALDELRSLAPRATVVPAWAPAGTRTVWTACHQDAPGGAFHTSGLVEVLEVGDKGELMWTGIGWGGSALLRIRTGAMVGLRPAPCAACGRPESRIVPVGDPSGWPVAAVLGREDGITRWEVERRVVDDVDELIVTLALSPATDIVELLGRLDIRLHATQYIVVDPADLDAQRATMAR